MKPTHGGKRHNAGRKPGTPRKRVTVALSEPARQRLADIKRDTGKSFTAILEALLEIPA
jgi:hypothetical protein